MNLDKKGLWDLIETVRAKNPLVHNITNYVVMNNTANALLAVGASPIMAHAAGEVMDMVNIAGALVINIGTLDVEWNTSMLLAVKAAKDYGKPFVLDPVGAGATSFRNQQIEAIIAAASPAVLRGNGSEILAVLGHSQNTKGVDSTTSSTNAVDAGVHLNEKLGSTVCISGEVDYIIDQRGIAEVHNGDPLMAKVTGTGCTCTAIIGAFLAANEDYFMATTAAMSLVATAGEIAAKVAKGPGSMQVQLLDKLYNISKEEFLDTVKIKFLQKA